MCGTVSLVQWLLYVGFGQVPNAPRAAMLPAWCSTTFHTYAVLLFLRSRSTTLIATDTTARPTFGAASSSSLM